MKALLFSFLILSCLSFVFSEHWESVSCSQLQSQPLYQYYVTAIHKIEEWHDEEEGFEFTSCSSAKRDYEIGGRAVTYMLYLRFKDNSGKEALYEIMVYIWGWNNSNIDVKYAIKIEDSKPEEEVKPAPPKDDTKKDYAGHQENSWFDVNCNSLSTKEKEAFDLADGQVKKQYGSFGLTNKGCSKAQIMINGDGVNYKFVVTYWFELQSFNKTFTALVLRDNGNQLTVKGLTYI